MDSESYKGGYLTPIPGMSHRQSARISIAKDDQFLAGERR